MVFAFLENALNLGMFTHAPFPIQNSWQNFLKICFPQHQKVVKEYELLYQNSVRKFEDDLEH